MNKSDQEAYSRMTGLASVKQMQALNKSMKSLIKDWLQEGFDEEDIKWFLAQRAKETIRALVEENVEMIKADLEAQDISMGNAKI